MRTVVCCLTLILLLCACAPQATAVPTPTETIAPTQTPEPTSTPIPIPPTFEPEFPPIPASAFTPAVNPPEFSPGGGPLIGIAESDMRYLQAQQAFRVMKWKTGQEGTPLYFQDQAAFEAAMADFLKDNPDYEVRQLQSDDKSSILTVVVNKNGSFYSVVYGFKNGALAFAEPNLFDDETRLGEVRVPKGLHPEFEYNPADGHWYLYAVDKSGNPIYWFKTDGATVDNLDSQWRPYAEVKLNLLPQEIKDAIDHVETVKRKEPELRSK